MDKNGRAYTSLDLDEEFEIYADSLWKQEVETQNEGKMKLILDKLYSYTALKAIYERLCVQMCIC